MPFGQAHTPDIYASCRLHAVFGPKHEFGRPAAQVKDYGLRLIGTDRQYGARKRQFRLFVAGNHLGFNTQNVTNTIHKNLTVSGIAGGTRRHETKLLDLVFTQKFCVFPRCFKSAVQGLLSKPSSGINPLPQADDTHLPHHVVETGYRATVNGFGAGVSDQKTDRVGTAVNCANTHNGLQSTQGVRFLRLSSLPQINASSYLHIRCPYRLQ